MNFHTLLPRVRDLLVERLDVLLPDCDPVIDNADYGHTFYDLDDFLLLAGTKFLGEVFHQKLQERIAKTETTTENKQCSLCKKNALPKQENENDRLRSRSCLPSSIEANGDVWEVGTGK